MTAHLFKSEQLMPRPVEQVFDFFKRPENLDAVTPKNLGFKILTPSPIIMQKGAVIDYTIQIYGIPMQWQTLITDYNPPCSFTDTQVKGPYKTWIHTHRFSAQGDGTLMVDEVEYSIAYGLIGEMARILFVKREIEKIFNHRRKIMNQVFGEKKE